MKRYSPDDLLEAGGLETVRKGEPDDLFLTCASFEDRSIAAASALAPGYRAREGLVYVNRELKANKRTLNSLNTLSSLLEKHCERFTVVEGSWLDAVEQLRKLRSSINPEGCVQENEGGVSLDTTTFNREALLVTLALLRVRFPRTDLRMLYASPKQHGKWLTRGFRNVRNVMGFAGFPSATRPTLLIVLSGFEPDRTIKIIEEHEPKIVALGIGDPPIRKDFLERNKEEAGLVLARQEAKTFKFPADDIENCWAALENLVKPYLQSHNIVVAPMSTKLSTVAAYRLARKHPEIQLTYCVPGEYNTEDYSSGTNEILVDHLAPS